MELKQMQKDAGNIKHSLDRLDWMYEVPVSEDTSKEDYLLGKKEIVCETNEVANTSKLMSSQSDVAGSTFIPSTVTTNVNDMYRKINEDPMKAIKEAEKQQRLNVLRNPVLMKQLRESVKAKKKEKKS